MLSDIDRKLEVCGGCVSGYSNGGLAALSNDGLTELCMENGSLWTLFREGTHGKLCESSLHTRPCSMSVLVSTCTFFQLDDVMLVGNPQGLFLCSEWEVNAYTDWTLRCLRIHGVVPRGMLRLRDRLVRNACNLFGSIMVMSWRAAGSLIQFSATSSKVFISLDLRRTYDTSGKLGTCPNSYICVVPGWVMRYFKVDKWVESNYGRDTATRVVSKSI